MPLSPFDSCAPGRGRVVPDGRDRAETRDDDSLRHGAQLSLGRVPSRTVPFPPMEAELVAELPAPDGWQYEPKWDGFRGVLENTERRARALEPERPPAAPLLP